MGVWGEPPRTKKVTVNEYTSSQTLSVDNQDVLVDASSGSVTITLPASSSNTDRRYTIKKKDSSGNKVIIDANGSETIDGETTVELKLQYQYVTILCDGTEWFIIGGEYVKMEDTLENILEKQKDANILMQRQILLLGKVERHISDERQEEINIDEIREELKEELDDVLDYEVG